MKQYPCPECGVQLTEFTSQGRTIVVVPVTKTYCAHEQDDREMSMGVDVAAKTDWFSNSDAEWEAHECKITIGYAFEKSGNPVPLYSWLVYWPVDGTQVSNKYWFYLDHNDPTGQSLYWMPHENWEPVRRSFSEELTDLLRGQIYESVSLTDMVVTEAIETLLPSVVREAIE